MVGRRIHSGLEAAEFLPGLVGRRKNEVSCALARTQESTYFLWVLFDKVVVSDIENAAEAAAAELCKLIDAEHLHFVARAVLASKPLLKLNHLDILEAYASIDFASDDRPCDVHAHTNGLVVIR